MRKKRHQTRDDEVEVEVENEEKATAAIAPGRNLSLT